MRVAKNVRMGAIVATLCLTITFLVLYGLTRTEGKPGETVSSKHEVVETFATETTLDNIIKASAGKSQIAPPNSTTQQATRLNAAQIHEIQRWNAERDYTAEHQEVYAAYDDETIFQLAQEGDKYALEEGFDRKASLGEARTGLLMLHEAAMLGSTSALISAGSWAEIQLKKLETLNTSTESIRKQFRLENSDLPLKESLTQIAASYYLAAMIRGNVHMSSQYLDSLQTDTLERPFTADEKLAIFMRAKGMYDSMESNRMAQSLGEFDNQYPESYAAFYGLPKNSEGLFSIIESASVPEEK